MFSYSYRPLHSYMYMYVLLSIVNSNYNKDLSRFSFAQRVKFLDVCQAYVHTFALNVHAKYTCNFRSICSSQACVHIWIYMSMPSRRAYLDLYARVKPACIFESRFSCQACVHIWIYMYMPSMHAYLDLYVYAKHACIFGSICICQACMHIWIYMFMPSIRAYLHLYVHAKHACIFGSICLCIILFTRMTDHERKTRIGSWMAKAGARYVWDTVLFHSGMSKWK